MTGKLMEANFGDGYVSIALESDYICTPVWLLVHRLTISGKG